MKCVFVSCPRQVSLLISALGPQPSPAPRSSSSPATLVLVALGGLVYFFLCLSMVWQDIAAGLAAVDRVLFVRILGFRSVAAAE